MSGEWFYVYGTRQTGQDFGRELYVARAGSTPQRTAAATSSGTARHGSRTTAGHRRASRARRCLADALGPPHRRQWVAVSKRDGDLGDFVYTWTAQSPVGPWTPRRGVSAPAGFDTGKLKYAPLAHPEIPLADGNLLVSISRNTTDFSRLLADPEVGRPVFAEVARP